MTPRVTVGLPVFNGARYLGAAIDSILAQTLGDFELIVSDNASTDGTEAIARAYAARDPRVRYVRRDHNVGLAENYNGVFRLARTPYFKWAASDDLLRPTFLERCVASLQDDPGVVLAYARTGFVGESGEPLDRSDPGLELPWDEPERRFRKVLHSAGWANVVLGVIRTEALARTGLVPAYYSGDFGLLGELSLLGKFAEVPETLYIRRLHERSSSQHRTETEWLAWYFTGRSNGFSFKGWSRLRHDARTLRRAPLPVSAKLSLAVSLARAQWWRRKVLAKELAQWAAWRLSRLRPGAATARAGDSPSS